MWQRFNCDFTVSKIHVIFLQIVVKYFLFENRRGPPSPSQVKKTTFNISCDISNTNILRLWLCNSISRQFSFSSKSSFTFTFYIFFFSIK